MYSLEIATYFSIVYTQYQLLCYVHIRPKVESNNARLLIPCL
jgi:hypothetical protein